MTSTLKIEYMKKFTSTVVFALIALYANAQTSISTQNANNNDLMRSNGKILVVVAVILIIMSGFFGYLISVDRKITKLEKEKK